MIKIEFPLLSFLPCRPRAAGIFGFCLLAAASIGAPPAIAGNEEPGEIILESEDGNVIRMVIETDEGDEDAPTICVWIPSDEGGGGALSCPEQELRVFGFPGHGEQVVIGETVLDEDQIRAMIEMQVDVLHESLGDLENFQVEYLEEFDEAAFQREMAQFQREMEQLEREMAGRQREFHTSHGWSEEEQEAFEEEMEGFAEEMADFAEEMAELQSEVMSELAEELAGLALMGARSYPTTPRPPHYGGRHIEFRDGRQLFRSQVDGAKVVTLVEQVQGEDGSVSTVVRTTRADTVEVIEVTEDELREHLE